MTKALRAGFIGLGDMGGPMAQRLIDAGFATTLWARRDASLKQYAPGSFARAETPRALGAASDVVGICVFGDDDLRQVLLGEDGVFAGMAPGGAVLIHSTATMEVCTELAAIAAEAGIGVLDAPVTGGRTASIAGKLTVMAGGDQQIFEKAKPFAESYSAIYLRTGPIGSGQKMKVLNNSVTISNGYIARLALNMADSLGLDPVSVRQVLRSGSAGSFSLSYMLDRVDHDPEFQKLAAEMIRKDSAIFDKVCDASGVEQTLLNQLFRTRGDLG